MLSLLGLGLGILALILRFLVFSAVLFNLHAGDPLKGILDGDRAAAFRFVTECGCP